MRYLPVTMRTKREKVFQILIASFVTITFSYVLFLTSNTSAKVNDNPGEKFKQFVQQLNTDRNNKKSDKKKVREHKIEIAGEVKGENDENSTENNYSSPTSTPINIRRIFPSITPYLPVESSAKPTVAIPTPTIGPISDACIDSGGTWRVFPNSCGDSCALVEDPGLMCLDVLREACDCGPHACWNGNSCVNNPTVGKPLPTPSIEVPPAEDKYVCGNGICDPGESYIYDCPVCLDQNQPCPLRACVEYPGYCPQDCDVKPIDPII